jgi:hypothetical protein
MWLGALTPNLLAQCHTGGCLSEMNVTDQQSAVVAKQQGDTALFLMLGLTGIWFIVLWGRQFVRDRRKFRE